MKKILLTSIVFLGIGSVVMAQQSEDAKQTKQKSGIQKRAEYNAKVLANNKAQKKSNQSPSVSPGALHNRKVLIDESKSSVNTSN